MKKGFTLVELLAVMVILALISSIGVYSFTSLIEGSSGDYYNNLKDNLRLAASSYFTEHRNLRPSIDEVCNKVPVIDLINAKEIKEVKDSKGTSCDLNNSYVYIKRNSNKQYEYNASLICGKDKFLIDEETYCVIDAIIDTSILVSAVDSNNNNYIITRSYSNTEWIKNNVTVTFSSSENVTKYIITNTNSGNIYTCNATLNSCQYEFMEKGTYNVVSYNDETVVSNRNFNIRIDKTSPTFTLREMGNFNISDGTSLTYENSLDNIIDESGIKSIQYELLKSGVMHTNETTNSTSITIRNLTSGNYTIKIKAYDQVMNESVILTNNFYITRNIQLYDPANSSYNETHEVIDSTNYNYLGKSLPTLTRSGYTFLGWYTTSSGGSLVTNTTIVSSTNLALYARWS